MQLTRFDRWLKERFIYETHILTLRLPDQKFPGGVSVSEIDQKRSGDYRYRLIIKDNDLADEVMQMLKQNRLMYATHVVEGKYWYNERIAPKGKSFTYRWILRFIGFIGFCLSGWGAYFVFTHPELVATVKGAIEELQSGL